MAPHRLDIHQHITDRIVAAIEADPSIWQRPWHAGAQTRRPVNVASGNAYRGINILALWVEAQHCGYGSAVWGTYRQWAARGCQVRKGSAAAFVVFYREITIEADADDAGDDTADTPDTPDTRLIARASPVFNADQVDGHMLTDSVSSEVTVEPIAAAEAFVIGTGAGIVPGGPRACYQPAFDWIRMPERTRFIGTATSSAAEAYYATLLHELTHWTGARHRLNRDLSTRFGSHAYAVEELVAELGAAFLCADLAITSEPRADHAQYIAHWLQVMKTDKRAIFTAASKASQAVDFLHAATASPAEPSAMVTSDVMP